jgi:hypothetical protein
MEKPPIPIEDWAVVESVSSPAYRALEPERRLTGFVIGHANLPNGFIYTSPIVRVDESEGLVETRNSVYRLGRPSVDYLHWVRATENSRAA